MAAHGAAGADELERKYAERAPLKAAPEAQDVAEAIAWLVEGARRVTGEIIYVDGGMHIASPRVEHSITSSSAPARPAACWRTACPRTATKSCCSRPGRATRDFWIHVPLGYGKLFARTDVNWAYESEPEPALNGRRIFTPRGKVLGGSSSINGLVYIRGQREDFDGWGIPGWDFARSAPYFEKAERELKVSDLERHELCDAFIDVRALRSASRATTTSTARRRKAPATTARPRTSAAGAAPRSPTCVRPRSGRTCGSRPNALGDEGGLRGQARASAWSTCRTGSQQGPGAEKSSCRGGTFNSPQLLQLSGVGPRALLERHGIPVVHDAPQVGERLQDHFYVRTFWRCTQGRSR